MNLCRPICVSVLLSVSYIDINDTCTYSMGVYTFSLNYYLNDFLNCEYICEIYHCKTTLGHLEE